MPRKKQNERGTNKQEIINIETKSSTFQEKQRQSKTDQISTVWRKEQKKQELKVHTELHPQHRTGFNEDKGTGILMYFVCILFCQGYISTLACVYLLKTIKLYHYPKCLFFYHLQ